MMVNTINKIYRLAFVVIILVVIQSVSSNSQELKSAFKLARVKYSGGGDWYNDPSSEVNLLNYISKSTNIKVNPIYEYVELGSDNLFLYPVLFLTGHGNIKFTDGEVRRLRAYIQNGGFLYIDDDYGLDPHIRREMKKVFHEQEFVELPFNHGIFTSHFEFKNGFTKIHEHDDKPQQTFGLFYDGRLCVVYTFETNPSDGWADPDIHNDPPEKREQAFRIGTNIVVWALSN